MGCPVCEGRTGPETLLEVLCQKHFDEAAKPSEEELRSTLEETQRVAEATQLAVKPARQGCGCFGKRKKR